LIEAAYVRSQAMEWVDLKLFDSIIVEQRLTDTPPLPTKRALYFTLTNEVSALHF